MQHDEPTDVGEEDRDEVAQYFAGGQGRESAEVYRVGSFCLVLGAIILATAMLAFMILAMGE